MATKKYNLIDKKTNAILAESNAREEIVDLFETYVLLDYDVSISETASVGATSASSIAVNFDSKSQTKNKNKKRFKDLMKGKIINTFNPRNFLISVNENFDIESVFSRLSSMEKAGQPKKTEGTTFGIEDDNGNIMKVTVRADQAKDFEYEVATYLADIKMNVVGMPKGRDSADISMAELLFKMKDKYDIIDVEFPKIPGDVIYNADKASYKTDNMTQEPDMGEMGDLGGDLPSQTDSDDPFAPLDLTNQPEDETDMDAAPKDDMELDMEDDLTDDDTVSDFPEEPEPSGEGSILDKVIAMLKSQADADIEKAKAEAEKARAEQARFTAQATQFAQREQEEQLRYELEMEEQKKREKEAKRLADMAKHKISKTLSTLGEAEEGMTPEMVMRQRQQLAARFKPEPTDTPEDKAYKNAQRNELNREYASKYRQAQNRKRYDAIKDQKLKNQKLKQAQDRNKQNDQQNQDGNNQQRNQPNAPMNGNTNEI